MKPITVLSLFDGISCGQVALQRACIPVEKYLASEIDKYAIQVTQKNYPNTVQLGDVRNLWASQLPKIDLLIGGSPCQDLSVAKTHREGLNGARSSLFWHFVKLVRTCKPKYFLLENVASMPKESKERITLELGVEPILINSALVSGQQRKRYYWTNIPNITQPADKHIILKDVLESGIAPQEKSRAVLSSIGRTTEREYFKHRQGQMIAEAVKIGYIGNKPHQSTNVYSVYNKSVALCAGGGGLGAKTGLYKIDLPDGDYLIRKLTPIECERLQTLPDNYTEGLSNSQRYKCIGNGWTVDVIAHIFKFMEF